MEQVFNDLMGTPGVVGCFVFSPPDKVLVNTLASRLDGASLLNTGKLLQRIHSTARLNVADVSEVHLLYEEALLLVKEITDKTLLVVMCEASANPPLITMSIATLQEELKAWVQSQQAARPLPDAEARPAPAAPKVTPEEQADTGLPAETLSELQAALARVMGPMASIIFTEAQGQWMGGGSASEATLGELVKILTREIKDPERIKRFRELVGPLLRAKR
jgi:hypothetical protein